MSQPQALAHFFFGYSLHHNTRRDLAIGIDGTLDVKTLAGIRCALTV